MDKRGFEIILSNIIFLILVMLFFVGVYMFISNSADNPVFYERVYARKIALLIDLAKPGTTLYVDISKLYELAENKKFRGRVVEIDNTQNKVFVRTSRKKGASYPFFNDLSVEWNLLPSKKKLVIKIPENEKKRIL